MALTKNQKVHGLIHSTSASSGGVGAGLSQIPGSDILPITALQAGMITGIALIHKRKITEATATMILGTFTAGMVGRAISQWLVGWIPGWGNAINAATAVTLTQAVGCAADAFFERLGDEPLSDEELKARAEEFQRRKTGEA